MREQAESRFHFGDIGLPLRIAAVAILAVLSIVGVGSTVRYAASLPKPATTNTQGSSQTTNTTPAPTGTKNNPAINQPQASGGSSGGSVARCSTTQRNSFTSQYNSQVASENARHQSVLSFLTSTNAPASAFAAEDATHSANLASINSQYQSNLRSIGC
jgi:hypothetical protein